MIESHAKVCLRKKGDTADSTIKTKAQIQKLHVDGTSSVNENFWCKIEN